MDDNFIHNAGSSSEMPKAVEKPASFPNLDALDHRLIELLRVNARLPMVAIARALGCARSTAQLRLKALEDAGVITGYTASVGSTRGVGVIRAMVLVSIESKLEPSVVRELARRHEITKLYSVSGRYDLCAMVVTDSTRELDAFLDKIRVVRGVVDTFSTILLTTKLDRPE